MSYLIVPDLKPKVGAGRCVVGLSGPIAASKTTAARYLERQGFKYLRFSQIIKRVKPTAPAQTYRSRRPEPTMWSSDAGRNAVPVTRDGKRSLPDARRKITRRTDG